MIKRKVYLIIYLGYLIYIGSLIINFQGSKVLSLIFVTIVYFYCSSNIINFFKGDGIRVSMVEKLNDIPENNDARLMAVIAYVVVLLIIVLYSVVEIYSWLN
ncbi:hypothetical protein N480_00020 [Pseudoalteromonas luteoviolacea S2607]|nr:hypothetical protein N480_00020 [Pseudoalteromonas luteoviolacea S2607]